MDLLTGFFLWQEAFVSKRGVYGGDGRSATGGGNFFFCPWLQLQGRYSSASSGQQDSRYCCSASWLHSSVFYQIVTKLEVIFHPLVIKRRTWLKPILDSCGGRKWEKGQQWHASDPDL